MPTSADSLRVGQGVTQPGTIQWLNPNAFVSAVDPSTGACVAADNPQNCQFGNLGRNASRGPDFVWSDFYLAKWFALNEKLKLRAEGEFFNIFNHPNFGLPSIVIAGIPGSPATQTGFGALTYTTSPPTGLLGDGLGGQFAAHDCLPGALGVLKLSSETRASTHPAGGGVASVPCPASADWL